MWLEECKALCSRAKFVGEEVVWRERDNHAGALAASAVILDEDRVVIPGLQFHGEVQNRQYGPYQKYSLMLARGGRKLRVFALEVVPSWKRSHIEDGLELFGPHLHLGDDREDVPSHRARRVLCKLDERSVKGWILRFQRQARVYDGDDFPLIAPFEDELFGL